MSMHLVSPKLTTTGRKKGKKKFRTADNAMRSRELKESWNKLLVEHGVSTKQRKKEFTTLTRKPPSYRGSDEPRIPSHPFVPDVCPRPADKVYTGDKCIGVTVMHKSCLQPVFNKEEAVDAAKMRR